MHEKYSKQWPNIWIVVDGCVQGGIYRDSYKIYNIASGEMGWDTEDSLKECYDTLWEPEEKS